MVIQTVGGPLLDGPEHTWRRHQNNLYLYRSSTAAGLKGRQSTGGGEDTCLSRAQMYAKFLNEHMCSGTR